MEEPPILRACMPACLILMACQVARVDDRPALDSRLLTHSLPHRLTSVTTIVMVLVLAMDGGRAAASPSFPAHRSHDAPQRGRPSRRSRKKCSQASATPDQDVNRTPPPSPPRQLQLQKQGTGKVLFLADNQSQSTALMPPPSLRLQTKDSP
eukprot:scaffold229415_cov29-Tisochrysis_lutea.AAC.6